MATAAPAATAAVLLQEQELEQQQWAAVTPELGGRMRLTSYCRTSPRLNAQQTSPPQPACSSPSRSLSRSLRRQRVK